MKRITNCIILLLLALVVLSSTFVSTCGAAEKEPSAQFKKYFVTTKWVNTNKKHILLIDTRVPADYNSGHIAGAINVPHDGSGDPKYKYMFTRQNGNPAVSTTFEAPTTTEFIALTKNLGITPSTTVVAYDSDVDWGFAARFAWTLQLYGHKKAYSMIGGFPKWRYVDERAWTTDATAATETTKTYPITAYSDILATKYDVLAALNDSGTVIFDTRTDAEQADGYISLNAKFLNWQDVLTDNDKGAKNDTDQVVQVLKSESDLRTLFATEKGVTKDKTIITYCAVGLRSAHVAEILLGLGYPNVRNYDGSWTEWNAQDPSVYPVTTPGP